MTGIARLEWLTTVFNWIAIIGVGISFIFGSLYIAYTCRLGRATKMQHETEMQSARVRIEETKAIAAKANNETEVLAQENIKLRADLESATAEARSKQSELIREQRELTKAHKELAQAEEKRAETQIVLEKMLEEVRQRQAPRTLLQKERERLVKLLKAVPDKGAVTIQCVLGDSEGYGLAVEIEALLKTAGWAMKKDGIEMGVFSKGNPKGVLIGVHSAEKAPAFAGVLQKAFADIGIELKGYENSDVPGGEVFLVVGNKP